LWTQISGLILPRLGSERLIQNADIQVLNYADTLLNYNYGYIYRYDTAYTAQ